jgi:hypothetical protein
MTQRSRIVVIAIILFAASTLDGQNKRVSIPLRGIHQGAIELTEPCDGGYQPMDVSSSDPQWQAAVLSRRIKVCCALIVFALSS